MVKKIIKERQIIIPWFRGEPDDVDIHSLLPKLFRGKKRQYHDYLEIENKLLQNFRLKAYAIDNTPPRDHIDEWLFLARHFGLPTRLLDWTEGALIALYFSLLEEGESAVWMLDPLEMNHQVMASINEHDIFVDQFPLTWVEGTDGHPGFGHVNIKAAWVQSPNSGIDFPIAVHPPNIHNRIFVQKSCFTVHGKKPVSISSIFPRLLVKFSINQKNKKDMSKELTMLGISNSTLFPDLDGLCKDLSRHFDLF